MNHRIVLDTSVLVSAALRIGSIPHQALQHVLATCDLCASIETLDELARVLERKKFDLYLDRDTRREFVMLLRRHAQLYRVGAQELATVEPSCRDPNDNQFLALANVCQASALVTSDEDLLVLHPWHGIEIVTPANFLTKKLLL